MGHDYSSFGRLFRAMKVKRMFATIACSIVIALSVVFTAIVTFGTDSWFGNGEQGSGGVEIICKSKFSEYKIYSQDGVITEKDLQQESFAGYANAGWYYEDSFIREVKAGDVLSSGTTIYARYHNPVEVTYWQAVNSTLLSADAFAGSGTEQSPYLIENSAQLGALAYYVNNNESDGTDLYARRHYKLVQDVRLEEVAWTAIGTMVYPFEGTFDGDGHMVYSINGPRGLFYNLKNATIKNLTIRGVNIVANYSMGGLSAYASDNTLIENCSVYGYISTEYGYLGGFVGWVLDETTAKITIRNCVNAIALTHTGDFNATGGKSVIGGIVGKSNNAEVIGCSNMGVLAGETASVGGIVGTGLTTDVSYSNNTGKLFGGYTTGGVVGNLADSSSMVLNSSNGGQINATGSNIGGVAGLINCKVVNSYNIEQINIGGVSSDFVGGIVGFADSQASVENCYSLGNVVAKQSILNNFNPVANTFVVGAVKNCGFNMTTVDRTGYRTKADSSDNNTLNYNSFNGEDSYTSKLMYDNSSTTSTQANLIELLSHEQTYTSNYANEKQESIWWNTGSDNTYVWNSTIMNFGGSALPTISTIIEAITTKHVTFIVDGKLKAVTYFNEGETIVAPILPAGREVSGWYLDATCTTYPYTLGEMGNENIVLYAKSTTVMYSVTKTLVGVTGSNSDVEIAHGKDYKITYSLDTGRDEPVIVTVTMGGETLVENYDFSIRNKTLTINNVTGDIVYTLAAPKKSYAVLLSEDSERVISSMPGGVVEYGEVCTLNLRTDHADWVLPNQIKVTMGGVETTDYTYSSSTGNLVIGQQNGVTGEIIIQVLVIENPDVKVTPTTLAVDETDCYSLKVALGDSNTTGYAVNVYKDGDYKNTLTATGIKNVQKATTAYSSSYMSSSSGYFSNTNYSNKSTTAYVKIKVPFTGTVSFQYYFSSSSSYNYGYIYLQSSAGSTISTLVGKTTSCSWTTKSNISVTEGQLLYFYYYRGNTTTKGYCYFDNIVFTSSAYIHYEVDIASSIAEAGNYEFRAIAKSNKVGYRDSDESSGVFVNVYPVTTSSTNLISSNTLCANTLEDYATTISAPQGYAITGDLIQVLVGGEPLDSSLYSCTMTNLVIKKEAITGPITIVGEPFEAETLVLITINNCGVMQDVVGATIHTGGSYFLGEPLHFSLTWNYQYYRYVYFRAYDASGTSIGSYWYDNSSGAPYFKNIVENNDDLSFDLDLTGLDCASITLYIESDWDNSCLVAGTYITLANGKKKKIEDIEYDDELLVWDFDKGCFAVAKPLFISKRQVKYGEMTIITLENGSQIKIATDHAIFSVDQSKFVLKGKLKIGERLFDENGNIVKIAKIETRVQEVVFYNVFTNRHINMFASGTLVSVEYNNLYDIKDMKFVKDNRVFRKFEDYDVPRFYYEGMRLAEQTERSITKVNVNYNSRLSKMMKPRDKKQTTISTTNISASV